MNKKIEYTDKSSEIDILSLLFNLWNDKYYIIITTFFSLFCCIFYLNSVSYTYTVTLQVTPTEEFKSSNAQTSIGGLARFIGLSTNKTSSVDSFIMYKALLKSRLAGSVLAKDKEFISKHFVSVSDQLLKDGSEVVQDKSWRSSIKLFLGIPNFKKEFTLVDYIFGKQDQINIYSELGTQVTTISMEVVDPKLGIEFLEKIHNICDDILRDRQLQRTTDYIKFLNKQLSLTTKQDQRLSLISTLADQQRSKMIASSDMAYAAEYFGEPYKSPSPTKPIPTNYLIGFMLFGFFGGVFFSMIKYFYVFSKN